MRPSVTSLIAAFALSMGLSPSLSQTFSEEMQKPAFQERITHLFGTLAKPSWLAQATSTLPVTISFGDQPYVILLACEPKNCAEQQVAVMFDDSAVYGLWVERMSDSIKEELTWLNVGNAQDSLDIKTLLYASITGSLDNHLEAFQNLASVMGQSAPQ